MIPSLFGSSTSSSGNSSSAVYVPRSPLSSEAELNSTFNASDYKGYLCKIGVHIWQSQPVDPADTSAGYEWRNLELTASEINAQNSYTQAEIDNLLAFKQTTANLEPDATANTSSIKYYSTAAATTVIDAKIKALKDGVSFRGTNASVTGDLNDSEINIAVPEATTETFGVTKVINELNDNSPHPPTSAPINQAIVAASDAITGGVSDDHNTLLKLSTDVTANKAALTTTNTNNTLDKLATAHTNLANNTYNKQEVDDKDTQAKDRANHTGTQSIATVDTLQPQLNIINASLASKPNNTDIGATDGIAQLTGDVVAIQHLSKEAHNIQSVPTFADLPTGDDINLNALYYATDDTAKTFYKYNPHTADWDILSGGGSGGSGGTTTVNLAIAEHSTTSLKISNSAGTDPVIPAVTHSLSGLMTVALHNKLEALLSASEYENLFNALNADIATKQGVSEKNQVNGYLGLNGDGLIDDAYIVQKIRTVASYEILPNEGVAGVVYIVETGDAKGIHLWSTVEGAYYPATADTDLTAYFNRNTGTLDDITTGSDNLHYTSAINTRLVNTSGTNTGDETANSIKTKRPLKTVNDKSLEGADNLELTTDDIDTVTNKRYATDAQLAKINSVETGAEANLQSDWNETDTASKAHIKNKPSVLSAETRYTCGQLVFHVADTVSGCLKFDGVSLYSKSTYAELYAIINNLVGTAFDNGDNFYLPDASGRVIGIVGTGAGLTARNLFEITGAETNNIVLSHTHDIKLAVSAGVDGGGFVPNNETAHAFRQNTTGSDQNAGTLLTDRTPNQISHITEANSSDNEHSIVQPTMYAAQNLFIAY
tara:strand:+ start:6588 stop:9074 length:2487 start_codon:yes stop_codon:yes gene_type:complete